MLEAHRTPGGGSPQGGAVTHHPCFSCHPQPRVRGEHAAVRADGDSGDGAATQTRFVLPDWTQTGLRTLLANLRFLLERMDEESRSSLWEELRQRERRKTLSQRNNRLHPTQICSAPIACTCAAASCRLRSFTFLHDVFLHTDVSWASKLTWPRRPGGVQERCSPAL